MNDDGVLGWYLVSDFFGFHGDRGVFGGGYDGSNELNIIDYITISNTGNAQDFGDLTVARYGIGATSNCLQ